MNLQQQKKIRDLKSTLLNLGSVAVAYSGGIDSTFLLKVAKDVLGKNVIAVTCKSLAYPEKEFQEVKYYTNKINVECIFFDMDILEVKEFKYNLKDRCYYCKYEMFKNIKEISKEKGINYVLDGSIVDDDDDFRPGMRALKELSIISPLKEVGLNKKDIREISKYMGIPIWDKQSNTCLASRIPYGDEINKEKLNMIERAEYILVNMGFKQVRVRHHGDIARIEVAPEERLKFFDMELMDKVAMELKKIGFTYVTLELSGYKTGSMNKVSDK